MSIDLPDSIDELEEGDLHGLKVILHRLEIEIKWKEKYLLTITEKILVRIDDLERRINEFGRSSMCLEKHSHHHRTNEGTLCDNGHLSDDGLICDDD